MTALVAAHAFAASSAWFLGAWQVFLSTKGDVRHRTVGRVWVGLALFVAFSSFWIKDLRPGQFSLLHILSVVTIVSVVLGILAARRGNIRAHQGDMLGPWIGMTFAGIFAFAIPERALPTFLVTDPRGAVTAAIAVIAATAAILGLARLLTRDSEPAPASVRG